MVKPEENAKKKEKILLIHLHIAVITRVTSYLDRNTPFLERMPSGVLQKDLLSRSLGNQPASNHYKLVYTLTSVTNVFPLLTRKQVIHEIHFLIRASVLAVDFPVRFEVIL